MNKLLGVVALMIVLTACGGSDGTSGADKSPTATVSEPAGTGVGASTTDFTYPPGAEVEELAPGITQYTVANSTTDLMKLYWENYFRALGYDKYNEANASVFYEKGSTKVQATYAQFDLDVRGTVKVLSK